MLNQNYFLVVLIGTIQLIDAVHSVGLRKWFYFYKEDPPRGEYNVIGRLANVDTKALIRGRIHQLFRSLLLMSTQTQPFCIGLLIALSKICGCVASRFELKNSILIVLKK